MSCGWRAAPDLWIGLAHGEPAPSSAPRQRRIVDQRAAASAERVARRASGLGVTDCTISRSHTQGVGAAAVGPSGVRLGVDLVSIHRVGERHAASILCPAEWAALESESAIRPALAWAIKEAAAKATRNPHRWFPDGLMIERGPGAIVVWAAECRFLVDWIRFGSLLCVWVREEGRRAVPQLPPGPSQRRTSLATRSAAGGSRLVSTMRS